MTVQEMVYQFKLEASRIDSKFSQGLKIPQIIAFLNRGMNQLLKTRYGTNNNYRESLEGIQKRRDEWQRLIVAHEKLQASQDSDDEYIYNIDLTKCEKKYLFLLRCSFIASKGECGEVDIFNTTIVESDDLNFNLDDPNFVSNFEWREINYRIAADNILAYTDSTFTVDKANIDYLRYPTAIDMTGYTHFDGSASSNVNCELPDFLHEEIVNEAVVIFKLRLAHPDAEAAILAGKMEE